MSTADSFALGERGYVKMRFIELNLLGSDGTSYSISVSITQIVSMTAQADDQCLLSLTDGTAVTVTESYDTVAGLLMDSGATYISGKVTHRPPHNR